MHKTWLFLSGVEVTNVVGQDFCNPRPLPHVIKFVTESLSEPV